MTRDRIALICERIYIGLFLFIVFAITAGLFGE